MSRQTTPAPGPTPPPLAESDFLSVNVRTFLSTGIWIEKGERWESRSGLWRFAESVGLGAIRPAIGGFAVSSHYFRPWSGDP
jgi:hypothetical protein